jgi:glycine betaine/proline transport system substrate-binding protein
LAIYDLYRVALPPYSDACYAVEAQIACDYPEDHLLKIFWPGLAEYAPDACQFLKNFTLTNSDQIQMMAKIQIDKQTVDQVVKLWIEQNQPLWRTWIPVSQ